MTEGPSKDRHYDWGALAAVVLLVVFLGWSSYASRKETRDGLYEACVGAHARAQAEIDAAKGHYVKDHVNAMDMAASPEVRAASKVAADADQTEIKKIKVTIATSCETRWPEPSLVVVSY